MLLVLSLPPGPGWGEPAPSGAFHPYCTTLPSGSTVGGWDRLTGMPGRGSAGLCLPLPPRHGQLEGPDEVCHAGFRGPLQTGAALPVEPVRRSPSPH